MLELFIANRYLRAKRQEVAISFITVISVIGVATGVMALVIAIAITNGSRNSMLRAFLTVTAHVTVQEKTSGPGIEGWQAIAQKLSGLPGVKDVTPSLFDGAYIRGPVNGTGVLVKGISTEVSQYRPPLLLRLKEGSFEGLRTQDDEPGVILGAEIATMIGAVVGKPVTVINASGTVTPFGPSSREVKARVAGIFESGQYSLDSFWVFMDLHAVQRYSDYPDVVNAIDLNLENIDAAREVAEAAAPVIGADLKAVPWQELHRDLLDFFRLLRRATAITIGLIQLVAALNILITLVMMVMEKRRDIAVLMSMGARAGQVRSIFLYKGAIIGAVGTVIGLVFGYGLSYLANHYRWLTIRSEMLDFRYIPLEPDPADAIWIAAVAMAVSLLASVPPARSATKIAPVESMRYE
jgi:lipoprotein-releasing system permease protein